jgi:hypothetical protein
MTATFYDTQLAGGSAGVRCYLSSGLAVLHLASRCSCVFVQSDMNASSVANIARPLRLRLSFELRLLSIGLLDGMLDL